MGFSRQGHWNGLPCLSPGDLPDPGIEPASLMSPALAVGSSPLVPPGKPSSLRVSGKFSFFNFVCVFFQRVSFSLLQGCWAALMCFCQWWSSCYQGHLLVLCFGEASGHNLRGDPGWGPRGGGKRALWFEEAEVGTKFLQNWTGTDGAGWDRWGSVSFSLGESEGKAGSTSRRRKTPVTYAQSNSRQIHMYREHWASRTQEPMKTLTVAPACWPVWSDDCRVPDVSGFMWSLETL